MSRLLLLAINARLRVRTHFFVAITYLLSNCNPNLKEFRSVNTVSYEMPSQLVEAANGGFKSDSPSVKKAEHYETIIFDDALELIGFGRAQLELIVICGVTIMATICETMGISVILPAAKCDLPMSAGNQGLLSGATFLGIMVSSYVWGYLSDTRGRRKMMRYGLYATAVCAVVSSFANDFSSLLVLRLMAGVW